MAATFRSELRSAVRRLWTDHGAEIQESLKKAAREAISSAYRECAEKRPAREFAACLRDSAEKAKLEEMYETIWGTRK